ncbi:hypothetical protein HZC21_03540 [Candidatus Peregrinibacteria bacterium]|nr:hypothetical protein [Candidatus Peregrinibacteria bacterium]
MSCRIKFLILAVFIAAIAGVSFSFAQYFPPPPLPNEYEKLPIDLDLSAFANKNPFPNEHCFFPVKGRKDIVEYKPASEGGTFFFPTGTCTVSFNQCSMGRRKTALPKTKFFPPEPLYENLKESSYRGFPVIPYEFADDIDFSKCMPSNTGYLKADNININFYEPPKRDYSKQSCYHPLHASFDKPSVFCDSEKCQLTETEYCENRKGGLCYKNGYPLKTKSGKAVTTFPYYSINSEFCTDSEGRLIPEDNGIPYEERFQPGCSYRIEAPNYHEKQYAGQIDFLIKCDENRCYNSGLNFDMKKKEYFVSLIRDKIIYTKTPPMPEFLSIDWTCRDANKVSDYNKKLLCTPPEEGLGTKECRLCYENKNFVYRDCQFPLDALGRRTDIPENERGYNIYEEAQNLIPIITALKENGEISWEMESWFTAFERRISIDGYMIDEPERRHMAFIISGVRAKTDLREKDVKQLRKLLSSYLTPEMKKGIRETCEICTYKY